MSLTCTLSNQAVIEKSYVIKVEKAVMINTWVAKVQSLLCLAMV